METEAVIQEFDEVTATLITTIFNSEGKIEVVLTCPDQENLCDTTQKY